MAGMLNVVGNGGLPKEILDRKDPSAASPRKKGLRQGGLMMLSSLIIIPIVALLVEGFNLPEEILAITAIVTFWGGFLRILYALIFQSKVPTTQNLGFVETIRQDLVGNTNSRQALPPQKSYPIPASYSPPAGNWQDTNELQPTSITENTTKTLKRNL